MAEEVAKIINDSKETVTLCYRNPLNRFLLLPPRVGKVLRANSQALAPARRVDALEKPWRGTENSGRSRKRRGRKSLRERERKSESERNRERLRGEREREGVREARREREREREREGDRSLA